MTRSIFEPEEMDYVEELRSRLKRVVNAEMYKDTAMFIRFLRARDHDLNAAERMLRNHLNWRKDNKIDSFLSWFTPPKIAEKYCALQHMGFDKDGSPVIYFDLGNTDLRGIVKSLTIPMAGNFIIHRLETDIKVIKERKAMNKIKVEQWSYVFNMENFLLSTATHRPALELVAKLITLYEDNYPEMLKWVKIVNASWYFQIAFAVIRPFITGHTFEKIKIFGAERWKDELLEFIDADELPAFLGGNRTDPDGDPMCRTFIRHGALVPEEYYILNRKKTFIKQPGIRKLIINRASIKEVELQVPFVGSDIEWEFWIKSKDIDFSLLYRKILSYDSVIEEVIPKQRCDTSCTYEAGKLKCNKEGIYYLQFDNTYSWVHQKEIYYRVQVINPGDKSIFSDEDLYESWKIYSW